MIQLIIQICVGSSCHLKGSEELVELFQENIEKYNLDSEITLAGSFCVGVCNRVGVTIEFDDEIVTGVTKDNFRDVFKEHVLLPLGIKE